MVKKSRKALFYRSAGVLLVFCWCSADARYTRVEAGKSRSEAGSLFIYKYSRSWKFIDS